MRRSSTTPTGLSDSLRTLWESGVVAVLSDSELLARFVERKDESAFTAIADRHITKENETITKKAEPS